MLDPSLEGAEALRAAPSSRLSRPFGLPALALLLACMTGGSALAATGAAVEPILIAGIPVDFILLALTLLGVALFHHHTFNVAMTGLAAIVAYKLAFTGFKTGPGLAGLAAHMADEWVVLANLFCLLMSFAILSRHFEKSEVPALMPRFLPDDWKGGCLLLVLVYVLSSFLDNIAAALIGGVAAKQVLRGQAHIGYLAAMVAASNAGGSGSVVADTTTTMMWIDGISPLLVLDVYIAAVVALVDFGIPAAFRQHGHSPIIKDEIAGTHIDWTRLGIVFLILFVAICANVMANQYAKHLLDLLPVIGLAVWVAIFVSKAVRKPDWSLLPENFKGTLFLLALVTSASLMPVEKLPAASWQTAFGLNFISAVFDNIPLTAAAPKQGGYDWGMLAYCVDFGGSMIWFGSSAGVAVSNMYQEAKSVGRWLVGGWHVAIAYIIDFAVLMTVHGWHPDANHKRMAAAPWVIVLAEPVPVAR